MLIAAEKNVNILLRQKASKTKTYFKNYFNFNNLLLF